MRPFSIICLLLGHDYKTFIGEYPAKLDNGIWVKVIDPMATSIICNRCGKIILIITSKSVEVKA